MNEWMKLFPKSGQLSFSFSLCHTELWHHHSSALGLNWCAVSQEKTEKNIIYEGVASEMFYDSTWESWVWAWLWECWPPNACGKQATSSDTNIQALHSPFVFAFLSLSPLLLFPPILMALPSLAPEASKRTVRGGDRPKRYKDYTDVFQQSKHAHTMLPPKKNLPSPLTLPTCWNIMTLCLCLYAPWCFGPEPQLSLEQVIKFQDLHVVTNN